MAKKVAAAGPIEGRWTLPAGWSWYRARDIAKIVGGSTPKNAADTTNYSEDGTPWLTPADLSGYNKATIGAGRRNLAPHVVNRSSLLPAGAVLISSRAPVGYCAVASNPMVTNQGFRSLVLADGIDPFFIRYYVLFSRKYLEDHASGTTFKELSGGALGDLVFPIPPREVQRTIVARIDELFAEIDDGEAALVRARDDLATWRKALLKAAVTGELTVDWRAANPSSESGAELLAHVAADLPPRKPRKPGVPSRAGEPVAMPFAVPSNWAWTTLDQIINSGPTNGYSPKRSTDGEGTQALKLTATTAGRLKLDSNCVKVLSETIPAGSPLYLNSGDLLFQRGNTREYVGMAAVYDGPPNKYIYPDLMIRVTLPDEALTQWVWRWAVSPHGRHYLMDAAQGGAGTMPKISGQTLRSMPVPLPPATELKFILAELERLTAETEAGHDDLRLASVTPATLRQSILAAAFRGELV